MCARLLPQGKPIELENFFSRLTLDIIGKAVFNYDFDSLSNDDPVIKVRSSHLPVLCMPCNTLGTVGPLWHA
jgi:hypothetical protein